MQHTSSFIIRQLEKLFTIWGQFVAINPFKVIVSSLVFTAICSLGFINFSREHRPRMLFIPQKSKFNEREIWLDKNFQENDRHQVMIFKSENILQPEKLRHIFDVYKMFSLISVEGRTFRDMCSKVPIADIFQSKRKRRETTSLADIKKVDYSSIDTS